MTFSWAIEQLKAGEQLQREGWNGEGMFVVAQKGYPDGIPANTNTAKALRISEGTIIKTRPYLALLDVEGVLVTGWVPSQTDMFADDWEIV